MPPDINDIPLRDIHLPDAISWWPLAIGWWLLIAMIILFGLIYYLKRRYREKRKVTQAALQELMSIKADYDENRDAQRFLEKLSILLRRVCLMIFPNQNVAGIIGKDWLVFLDQCVRQNGKVNEPLFTRKAAAAIINVPYMREIQFDDIQIEEIVKISQVWINGLPNYPAKSLNKPRAITRATRSMSFD